MLFIVTKTTPHFIDGDKPGTRMYIHGGKYAVTDAKTGKIDYKNIYPLRRTAQSIADTLNKAA